MIRHPVDSSSIVSAGYDSLLEIMEIEFESGVYRYLNVPANVYRRFLAARSKGRFVNRVIKTSFEFRRVRGTTRN